MPSANRHPLEMEARMFWAASSEFHRVVHSDAPDKAVADALDDIEVIMQYTDWPPLKDRCQALLNGEKYESAYA